MEPLPETCRLEHSEPKGSRRHRPNREPRTVAAPRPDRKARTVLARRRRLNALVRELARDLGFDLDAVTMAERAVLQQCATLMLQVEIAQDQLVLGEVGIDHDVCIRLSSEARRLLTGLRKRAGKHEASPTPPRWSPLRARIAATTPTPKPEVVE